MSAAGSGAWLKPGTSGKVAGELVVEDVGADLEQEPGATGVQRICCSLILPEPQNATFSELWHGIFSQAGGYSTAACGLRRAQAGGYEHHRVFDVLRPGAAAGG